MPLACRPKQTLTLTLTHFSPPRSLILLASNEVGRMDVRLVSGRPNLIRSELAELLYAFYLCERQHDEESRKAREKRKGSRRRHKLFALTSDDREIAAQP